MELNRNELIDYSQRWINEHPDRNNNPLEYISFLNGINDIISDHDYQMDGRFFTYGRRDFLRNEFSDYLNEKVH